MFHVEMSNRKNWQPSFSFRSSIMTYVHWIFVFHVENQPVNRQIKFSSSPLVSGERPGLQRSISDFFLSKLNCKLRRPNGKEKIAPNWSVFQLELGLNQTGIYEFLRAHDSETTWPFACHCKYTVTIIILYYIRLSGYGCYNHYN